VLDCRDGLSRNFPGIRQGAGIEAAPATGFPTAAFPAATFPTADSTTLSAPGSFAGRFHYLQVHGISLRRYQSGNGKFLPPVWREGSSIAVRSAEL
jgi:hypothetical protein